MIVLEWNKDEFTNIIIDMIHGIDTIYDNFCILPKKTIMRTWM